MKKHIIVLFVTSQIFAIGGFGMYGGPNFVSDFSSSEDSSGDIILKPGAADFNFSAGFFFYFDALPIVDFDVAFETGIAQYPFSIQVAGSDPNTFDWWAVRESQYYTVRKTWAGAGIPFLAKAQIYGGIGYNKHTVYPNISVTFIEQAFSDLPIEEAVNQDFSDGDITETVSNYIDTYKETVNGFHLQAGMQLKVTVLSVFINARYTIAKNASPGTTGFPTVWTGIAIGI